jgi:hypothetical protein
MKNDEKEELSSAEVNLYIRDCGDIKYECVNDCFFGQTPFMSTEE